MARVATTSRYTGRDSATADRSRPADESPFRSFKALNRIKAARAMIAKREAEIVVIKRDLAKASTPKIQRVLSQRLRASTNNLQSWIDYIAEGSQREARAVIIP